MPRNRTWHLFGARRPMLEELLASWVQEYPIQWHDPRVNLAELAKLRWIDGWSRESLAKRYGKSPNAIQCYFQLLKREDFRGLGLTISEIQAITQNIGKEI